MKVDRRDFAEQQGWYQLDNAAVLFPSVVSGRTTTLFRVSATLNRPVNASALQRALTNIMPRFPYYLVHLKHGAFWHYLIRREGTPRVEADATSPCMDPPRGMRRTYLFRTRASGRRVAVEFSHILTDGTGALTFLRALLLEYALQLGVAAPDSGGLFRKDEKPDPEEFEDAYARYFSRTVPSPEPSKEAFRLSSRLLPVGAYRTVTGIVPVSGLLRAAKERGVTITVLLAAVLAHSIYDLYLSLPRSKTSRKGNYVRVEVPVNLRNIFPTKSMRNFSLFVTPGIDVRLGPYSLDDIIELFHHYLKVEIEGRFINKQIARNIRGRRNPIVRVIPLAVKNLILPHLYFSKGEALVSTVLTNLGVVKMPDAVARMIEKFEFVPAPSKWNKTGCAVVSFGEQTCITFGRMIDETEVERRFFRSLVKLGIPVRIESK